MFMRFQILVCLALVAIVCAQTPQPQSPTAPASPAPGTAAPAAPAAAPEPPKVNPDDPVITIKGLCSDSSLQGDACKTVITKSQFEKITENVQPGMQGPMRRQFATRYSQVLVMSTEAEKRGLDKSAHFEESLRLARMQILAQELTKSLQTEAGNINDQDVKDYYDKNAANYEEATFVKIFVPHTKRVTPPPATPAKDAKTGATTAAKPAAKTLSPEEQQKAGEEAMKKEASLLRERLVKGEDPDKLEKAAFTAAGLPGNPPPTKMEKVRRTSLPVSQQAAMDLKPGEVSEVISDASGNYIYKLVSKDTLALDAVKAEIHNQLSAQRYRETMQHFQGSSEFNEAYFGPARPPAGMQTPPRPGVPQKDNDRD